MCFSTDMIHSGHIDIIRKAEKLGKLIIGVMSDEAVASYKRFPLLPFEERKTMFENIKGVYKVVEQETLSYKDIKKKVFLKDNFVFFFIFFKIRKKKQPNNCFPSDSI